MRGPSLDDISGVACMYKHLLGSDKVTPFIMVNVHSDVLGEDDYNLQLSMYPETTTDHHYD